MKITTPSLLRLGPVHGPSSGSFMQRKESIHRIRLAYSKLIEVEHGIAQLTDITMDDYTPFFNVQRGPYYCAFQAALTKGLIWCTDINDIDYPETIKKWKSSMIQGIPESLIKEITSNDLTLPQFAEFRDMFILYMISGTRFRGRVLRHPDFSID